MGHLLYTDSAQHTKHLDILIATCSWYHENHRKRTKKKKAPVKLNCWLRSSLWFSEKKKSTCSLVLAPVLIACLVQATRRSESYTLTRTSWVLPFLFLLLRFHPKSQNGRLACVKRGNHFGGKKRKMEKKWGISRRSVTASDALIAVARPVEDIPSTDKRRVTYDVLTTHPAPENP